MPGLYYMAIVLPFILSSSALPNCNEPDVQGSRPYLCAQSLNVGIKDLTPKPVKVGSTLYLHNIAAINEVSRTITLSLEIQIEFQNSHLGLKNSKNARFYKLTEEEIKSLNLPDIKVHKVETIPKNELTKAWFNNNTAKLIFERNIKVSMYCAFDFQRFPFDSQHCNFSYRLGDISSDYVKLEPPRLKYRDQHHVQGQPPLPLNQNWLPFDINFESKRTFNITKAGYETGFQESLSTARMLIHFKRNSLGLLFGGFYLPTLLFSFLSLISFGIHPDTVRYIFWYKSY